MKNKTLMALTAAALALPGMNQKSEASEAITDFQWGYQLTTYQEEDSVKNKTLLGDVERYDIQVHQLQFASPLGEQRDVTLNVTTETMSGASPMGIGRDANNKSAVIMSGASIDESRQDYSANLRQFFKSSDVALSVGYSIEDDYQALSAGLSGNKHVNNDLTTLSGGISLSSDGITPVESGVNDRFPERIDDEPKVSRTLFAGVSQIINRSLAVQLAVNVTSHSGFLSDPYKLRDQRPESRDQWSFIGKIRYFSRKLNAALKVDARWYNDSWGINAQTVDLKWHQNIGQAIKVIPTFRYYSQSQANFYYSSDDLSRTGFQSSDYRLSPYGAMTVGIKWITKFKDWSLSLAWENYQSSASLALKPVSVENPALVQFTRLSFGLTGKF
ncbi:MAG: DUF3570 domain-containing protein [Methylococcales bacterium]|mgnify:CR=1 FL=1|jgi:hypothetical protein|nr:DUF3570 domain-containing protein [Methylococcales bacterium]MBT7410422.1 DUF3570 domain-containing protein [Methylococcales bacterium]